MLTQQIMQKAIAIQSLYSRVGGPRGARTKRPDSVPEEYRISPSKGKKKTVSKGKKKKSVPAMRPSVKK